MSRRIMISASILCISQITAFQNKVIKNIKIVQAKKMTHLKNVTILNDAILSLDHNIIKSNEIIITPKDLQIKGNVSVKSKYGTINASNCVSSLDLQKIICQDVKIHTIYDIYLKAKIINKNNNEIIIENAVYSKYPNFNEAPWNIATKKIFITEEEKLQIHYPTFRFKNIPLIYYPGILEISKPTSDPTSGIMWPSFHWTKLSTSPFIVPKFFLAIDKNHTITLKPILSVFGMIGSADYHLSRKNLKIYSDASMTSAFYTKRQLLKDEKILEEDKPYLNKIINRNIRGHINTKLDFSIKKDEKETFAVKSHMQYASDRNYLQSFPFLHAITNNNALNSNCEILYQNKLSMINIAAHCFQMNRVENPLDDAIFYTGPIIKGQFCDESGINASFLFSSLFKDFKEQHLAILANFGYSKIFKIKKCSIQINPYFAGNITSPNYISNVSINLPIKAKYSFFTKNIIFSPIIGATSSYSAKQTQQNYSYTPIYQYDQVEDICPLFACKRHQSIFGGVEFDFFGKMHNIFHFSGIYSFNTLKKRYNLFFDTTFSPLSFIKIKNYIKTSENILDSFLLELIVKSKKLQFTTSWLYGRLPEVHQKNVFSTEVVHLEKFHSINLSASIKCMNFLNLETFCSFGKNYKFTNAGFQAKYSDSGLECAFGLAHHRFQNGEITPSYSIFANIKFKGLK